MNAVFALAFGDVCEFSSPSCANALDWWSWQPEQKLAGDERSWEVHMTGLASMVSVRSTAGYSQPVYWFVKLLSRYVQLSSCHTGPLVRLTLTILP
jgi:hypothetical protein